jgi:hypothetical protein
MSAEGERRLSERLVAFGDIVFGFTISQLALQLDLPHAPADLLANPIRYVVYAATFGFIALHWYLFHRLTSSCFRPTPIDLMAVFTYLAWLGLVPYALFAYVRFASRFDGVFDVTGARYGLGAFSLAWFGLVASALVIWVRNDRRCADVLPADARWPTRRRLIGTAASAVILGTIFSLDLFVGPQAALPCFGLFALVPVGLRRYARTRRPEP